MAPYVDAHTWTQDTADANYMLLTVVVNGHNCVALCRRGVAVVSDLQSRGRGFESWPGTTA